MRSRAAGAFDSTFANKKSCDSGGDDWYDDWHSLHCYYEYSPEIISVD